MYQWTYKNHFKCGYLSPEQSGSSVPTYFSQIGSPELQPEPAIFEAARAATLIYKDAKRLNKKVVICLSGGIDSEAMLRAFEAAEIPFEAVFLRFENELNRYDLEDNVKICEQLGAKFSFIDIGIQDFFESGKFLEYGKKYGCQSPQIAAHLYLLDKIDGCPVLAGNPLEIHASQKVLNHNLPGDLHAVYLRYFMKNNRPGVPFFFIYTPELCFSMLHTEIMQQLIAFGLAGASFTYFYEIKCLSYRQAGFNVTARRDKFTGFEKLRELYDALDNKEHGTAFNQRYREPLELLNPLPKQHAQIVNREHIFNKKIYGEIEKMVSMPEKADRLPVAVGGSSGIDKCFQKWLVETFCETGSGLLMTRQTRKAPQMVQVNADAWAYTQTESKLWLCRELEKLVVSAFEKPVKIWLLAGWYSQLSYLLFTRERINIEKITAFDLDANAIAISNHFHNQWILQGKYAAVLKDVNEISYDEKVPDILINTSVEHFDSLDWLKKVPKGCWFALQSNNLKMADHPNCFRSLKDFRNAVTEAGCAEILFEGSKLFFEDSPFQRFMIIGKK
jgi:hypothetical protein